MPCQPSEVARECRRIAGDIDDSIRCESDQFFDGFGRAAARRVENDKIKTASREFWQGSVDMADLPLEILEAEVESYSVLMATDGPSIICMKLP